jgi:hypothetical protein
MPRSISLPVRIERHNSPARNQELLCAITATRVFPVSTLSHFQSSVVNRSSPLLTWLGLTSPCPTSMMDPHESKVIVDGLSDLEDSPLTPGDHQPRFTRRNPRQWRCSFPAKDSPIWKYWSIGSTVCFLLLIINIIYYEHTAAGERWSRASQTSSPQTQQSSATALQDYPDPVDTWKHENLVETKYYRDTRYMTLDRDADYLWREYTLMSTGNIRLPDDNATTSLKSISM